VILIDVNILPYASNAEADQHGKVAIGLMGSSVVPPRSDYLGRPCLPSCGSRPIQERFAAR
jgi:hypothetical protein